MVMEYVNGGSLQDYLDRHGPPDWRTAARLAAEVASGLAAAHAQGLIHRDIKPSNILLQVEEESAEPGLAKLGDFGLARVADDSRLTQTGLVAGTPMYMAPEQARGEKLDHRADLFSLGSVLYTLCTGRDPFPGASAVVMLRHVCEMTPTPIRKLNPAVPPWLAAVVERLHAKHPRTVSPRRPRWRNCCATTWNTPTGRACRRAARPAGRAGSATASWRSLPPACSSSWPAWPRAIPSTGRT